MFCQECQIYVFRNLIIFFSIEQCFKSSFCIFFFSVVGICNLHSVFDNCQRRLYTTFCYCHTMTAINCFIYLFLYLSIIVFCFLSFSILLISTCPLSPLLIRSYTIHLNTCSIGAKY